MFLSARAILIYDWRRFLPAVLTVAFAGLLVLIHRPILLLGFFSLTIITLKYPKLSASIPNYS